jgi:gas vesicle protein
MRSLILILILIFNLQAKSLFSNDAQAQTSKYINNLKDLIIATQKTRGLTNSYLNGNTAAMLLVYSSRDDMKKAIGDMEAFPLAADPVINSRATAISQALVRLNQKAFKQKATKSFSEYTEQIEQTLMLAQSANKRSAKDLSPFGKEISSVMMEIMLPMTEYTGRLRGFGAGLAAKGKVSKNALEKIKALSYQLKSLNQKLQEQMSMILINYSKKLPVNIKTQLSVVDKDVKKYTSYAQKHFAKDPKNIDSNEYFDKGTNLISEIVNAYDTADKAVLEDSKGWF